jgi:hypothetical protein
MLFANPIAAECPLALACLNQAKNSGLRFVSIQLPDEWMPPEEGKKALELADIRPLALRAPSSLGLGTSDFRQAEWEKWIHTLSALSPDGQKLILHGSPIPLGLIFEYLDKRPTDFHALGDFKSAYIEKIMQQVQQIKGMADEYGIQLYLENAPMGGEAYFEPGRTLLYPSLRTPRHLLQIAETMGIGICFNSANARITSNALTYMHRSRSLFAGATEEEITGAADSWIDFYQRVKTHTGLIRLSYAISWGDTPHTTHIPFPESSYPELIQFAEQVNENIPVILALRDPKSGLKPMLDVLYQLKKS